MKKLLVIACMPLFLMLFLLFLLSGSPPEDKVSASNIGINDKVRSYQPLIEKYAAEFNVSEYVPYLMAIMMVESRGEGNDPMQSSESIDGRMGNITDPESSIKQGVLHFSNVLKKSIEKGSDVWAAVQAYNYGSGFIDFVSGEWRFEQAVEFSKKQSNGQRVVYKNHISQKHGYDYRYDYGNMFYVLLVRQYMGVAGNGELKLPVPNYKVTSIYGEQRRLILQDGRVKEDIHSGVDFVYSDGRSDGEIFASGDGTVVYSSYATGFGNLVVIKHHDTLYSYYAHLSTLKVRKNDIISTGQVVGLMGTSGDSTGIHLHFGVSSQLFSNYLDPTPFLGIENKIN